MNDEVLRQGRILMVDDEVSSLCLLENVLQRLRFPHVRKLSDPTRIIEEFDAYEPDLVITDIEMPEMDGIELVEKLRSHLPRDTCLPILVLTGSSDPRHKRRALAVGATDIIAKPFDSAEIQMRIRNLLEMRFQRLEIESHNRVLELKVAERTAELRLPGDFIAIDARGALDALGLITGETVTDDIVHRIFRDFCVGK